jgi:hypothetical protein
MFNSPFPVVKGVTVLTLWTIIMVLFLFMEAFAIPYPFCDDMEDSASGNWCFDAPWGYTSQHAQSGTLSITDSPDANYENDVDVSFSLCSGINLISAQMPVLSFWHRYDLETNHDYVYIDVSINAGASWSTIYFVTGHATGWKKEKVDLSPYAGYSDVRIRFRLQSDASGQDDGWYIDDVCIQETDNPVIAYPFIDDMENGNVTDSNWLSSSWELIDWDYHSPTHSWTESPEGDYPYHLTTYVLMSLTLAGCIDLPNTGNPQLAFWHHYDMYRGFVDVSTDYGHTWTYLKYFDGTQLTWEQYQIDLSDPDYMGDSTRIRFRVWCRSSGDDGWYIEDVRIKDAPPHVELKPLTNVTMHGTDLCWSRYTGSKFERYEVYRDLWRDVDRFDSLVYATSDPDDTCWSDTYCILEPDYYRYRVYIVDSTGMYCIGSNERKAHYVPPMVAYPFCDSMEGGTDKWDWCPSWGVTTEYAHSGSFSWTDSPGAFYQDSANTALETRTNLNLAQMPVLSFWHRYDLETNHDFVYIDVSTDEGVHWSTIYFVTGHTVGWKKEKVDLSQYAESSDVRIRFRLKSDASGGDDGWYIDDVCIQETDKPVIAYPFIDDMESGALTDSNWLSSSWEVIDSDDHSPTHSWTDSPEGDYPYHLPTYVQTSLTLAGYISLPDTGNPQLAFWHHHDMFRAFVEVSENFGHTWTPLDTLYYDQPAWKSDSIDLSDYMGQPIRIRFHLDCRDTEDDGWYIDDVWIGDSTLIAVTSPNGGEHWCVDSTYDITWSSSGIAQVKIEYTTDGGSSWSTIEPSIPAVTGIYAWTVWDTISTNCKVRICDAADNDPCDESDNSFTIDACEGCVHPVHFVFRDNTEDSYSIVIDSAFLDGLELEECDEIGVFDDTGNGKGLLCVGASVYHPGALPIPLIAWEDDPNTDQIDGYIAGDTMYFRVWSSNQEREECALSYFKDGEDGTFEWDPSSQLWLGAPCVGCEVSPTSLDFDTVCVGEYSDTTFTISNTEGGTLSGTVSEACADYSLVGDVSYNLTAGESDTFTVRFEPQSSGPKNCTIETGNDLCSDVECSGVGEEPECDISPTSLDFDTVCVGDSLDTTFTITNTGRCTLSGTLSETCDDFSIVGSPSYNLGAGESDTFTVRFEPQSSGPKNCTIETGNDLCSDVSCSGIGADFTLDVIPDTLRMSAGTDSSYTVVLTSSWGFGSSCTLTVAGHPDGSTAIFEDSVLVPTDSTILTIAIPDTTTPDTFTLTITATEMDKGKGIVHSKDVTLIVTLPASQFNIEAFPDTQIVVQGDTTTYGVTIIPEVGFSTPCSLFVEGLPGGATADFDSNPILPNDTSTLTIITLPTDPVGEHDLAIIGAANFKREDTTHVMLIIEELTEVDKEDDQLNVPDKFALFQNQPNPFNPETKISYYLPRACRVKLTVYNTRGHTVRVLIDENQSAGYKVVHWNGKDEKGEEVSTGIYFYRIKAQDFTETKKMILLK